LGSKLGKVTKAGKGLELGLKKKKGQKETGRIQSPEKIERSLAKQTKKK